MNNNTPEQLLAPLRGKGNFSNSIDYDDAVHVFKQFASQFATAPVSETTGQVEDAINFGEWLRTFEPLTKENSQWVLDCQISTRELYKHFKK